MGDQTPNDYILAHKQDGIMTIRMNRPEKKNALTGAMYAAMTTAMDEAFASDDIRCVLFLGTPGCFTAGNDISDFLAIATSGTRDSMDVFQFLERIIMAPKALVAGVDGIAVGVGTTMLMHCDQVVASREASFKTPFVDLGLVPEAGSSLIGPQIMGHHNAMALLSRGETFSTERAMAAGLVTHMVESNTLEERARAVARDIADKPAEAFRQSRKLIRGDRTPVLERMKQEGDLFLERLKSDEARAAFTAFMAKGQTKKAS